MKVSRIACLCVLAVAVASVAGAADSRVYSAPIESVWDEAVKATRDVDLVVTESDRSEHHFSMKTPKKALSRTVECEVTLAQTGNQTEVAVRAVAEDGSKKSIKVIAKYLAALDKRLE
jgi:hypothetical protein